ncbi:hypothetical protein JAAARDRAFT_186570 [Jaapia argillacea MUCL 33604]|uniref:Protein kinase domain-containing protein n=1 Tax=Jaapia argillacea MUCL 33604 TaxID=933084 RepID=A0A067PHS1_9AGAM|nr:hypothetical protein JAAARDRAFT_186570 [Jaapia argillacea MUCL 33604]
MNPRRHHRTESRPLTPSTFVIKPEEVEIDYKSGCIGEGGFSTVYRGRWGGHLVAVKVLRERIPAKSLQQEIDIWQSIRHPNILEFYGYNSSSEPIFLVSALKKRGNAVAFFIDNPGASRPKLLYEASLGLQHLHRHSIIHGDLKALNILVDDHGSACLSDFGLSHVRTLSTSPSKRSGHGFEGTLQWMAPECLVGCKANSKSDIYSFGMTIYEVSSMRHATINMVLSPP